MRRSVSLEAQRTLLYHIRLRLSRGFWNFFQLFQLSNFRFPLIFAYFYDQQSVLLSPSVSGWRSAQRCLLYHIVQRLSRGFGNFFRFSFQRTNFVSEPLGFRFAEGSTHIVSPFSATSFIIPYPTALVKRVLEIF